MLIWELNNVTKYFGDRLIFNLKKLAIYSSDKIGLVGLNGSGKTTLLNIMAGKITPDNGTVKRYTGYAYITQFETAEDTKHSNLDRVLAQKFNLKSAYNDFMSEGEKIRHKIVKALSKKNACLIADEPTSNLDITGIKLLEAELVRFKGAVLIVSHDRELLDKVCNKILEIEDGTIKLYQGNYSSYFSQKEAERHRKEFEYTQFVKEKKKIEQAIKDRTQRVRDMRKTPKRMGNSEARLHKMGNQKAKANLAKAVQGMQTRIDKLEQKEKPRLVSKIKLDLTATHDLHSKVLIQGQSLKKGFGDKIIFDKADFHIYNRQKTAIIGDNGCGKTTLLKLIMTGYEGINVAHNIKFGYFSQNMNFLEDDKTVLENIMTSSIYSESFLRTILARLLIKRDDVYKKVAILSGGERVRICLAKIILSDVNMLVLDEPTNYLDILSMEAVERALSYYEGNVLFVSHDRRLINSVATDLLVIRNGKIEMFKGNYDAYLKSFSKKTEFEDGSENKLLLEYRLSEILGKLSMPSKSDDLESLDKEYQEIMSKLKN